MTAEADMERLLDKYGITYPACGAEVPRGWFTLLDRLLADLVALGWDRDCQQLKEKFGGLRCYVGEASAECHSRIRAAEVESMRTCEVCGAEGKRGVVNRWVSVYCDAHTLPAGER